MSNFTRKDNNFIHLKTDGQIVTDYNYLADAFANHLEPIYISFSLPSISPQFANCDLVFMSPISADGVNAAIKSL